MCVRLPSHERYVAQVEKEQQWLPRLAPLLPLPIPVPVEIGIPSDGYPWHWSVYRWLTGETATTARIDDQCAFADNGNDMNAFEEEAASHCCGAAETPGSQKRLVSVAPRPVVQGLQGLDDGMAIRPKVLRGMPAPRRVATPHMTAAHADSEMYPRPPQPETFLAPSCPRLHTRDLTRMRTGLRSPLRIS
jgi:hypothetical protein